MEIIEDGTFPSVPASMLNFIHSSVSTETIDRKDSLGLFYPGIVPVEKYGIKVDDTVVRSVYEYQYTQWGYIIEISIYRRWNGIHTEGVKPVVEASVSMYHRVWDEQTGKCTTLFDIH